MWTTLRFAPERIVPGRGHHVVVAVGCLKGKGRGSHVVVEQRIGILFELRDHKIRHCRSYPDPSDALEAAGLVESGPDS